VRKFFECNKKEQTDILRAPPPVDAARRILPSQDRKRIAEAVASGVTTRISLEDFSVETRGAPVSGASALLAELICQWEEMISVATGGRRIQDVSDYYIA
jgi:hypothetical protein